MTHCIIYNIYTISSHAFWNLSNFMVYKVFKKNGTSLWSPKVRTFWENNPNKNCSHKGLFFDDLELDLEFDIKDHLKVNIEFFNGNPLFLFLDLKKAGNFTFRYVVMSVVKVTSRAIWRSN